MTLDELLQKLSNPADMGMVILILLSLVEITPIKVSPLGWVGRRINQSLHEKLDEVEKVANQTQLDLQNHMAESMRREILDFQNTCLQRRKHTREEWTYIHKLCDKYDHHIAINHLQNSEVEEAINYIRSTYRQMLQDRDFIELLDQDDTLTK